MVEPRSTSEVIKILAEQGYIEDFKAHKSGMQVFPKDLLLDPDLLIVDKIYRFEGETNLDDRGNYLCY